MDVRLLAQPRRTTLVGGAGVAVAAVPWLLADLGVTAPVTAETSIVFSAFIPRLISAALLAVALIILAVGVRGESGIAGRSVVGKVALIVFGSSSLLFILTGVFTQDLTEDGASFLRSTSIIPPVIIVVAVVVAAVAVVRADLLHGFARWALVVVATGWAILAVLFSIPSAEFVYALVVARADVLHPLLLILLGLTYALQGQSAAIRRRAQIINENW